MTHPSGAFYIDSADRLYQAFVGIALKRGIVGIHWSKGKGQNPWGTLDKAKSLSMRLGALARPQPFTAYLGLMLYSTRIPAPVNIGGALGLAALAKPVQVLSLNS